jgi:hypothetical protein
MYRVPELLERTHKIIKDFMFGDGWNIFHRNNVWRRTFDEAGKLIEQAPSRAADNVVALRIG